MALYRLISTIELKYLCHYFRAMKNNYVITVSSKQSGLNKRYSER